MKQTFRSVSGPKGADLDATKKSKNFLVKGVGPRGRVSQWLYRDTVYLKDVCFLIEFSKQTPFFCGWSGGLVHSYR